MGMRRKRGRGWRVFFTLVAIVVIAGLGFAIYLRGPGPTDFAGGQKVALADYKDANPTSVPASMKNDDALKRGEYLTHAADCMVCHTARGGQQYAGGYAFTLPFGTIYSTNITPDKDTGIGNYTDQDFLNAMHRGVRKDGARLYPAMPFASYTYMTDEDALAIKAYLFSLAPARAPARDSLREREPRCPVLEARARQNAIAERKRAICERRFHAAVSFKDFGMSRSASSDVRSRSAALPGHSGTASPASATSCRRRSTAPLTPSESTAFGRPRAASHRVGLPASSGPPSASRRSSAT